MYVGSFLVEGTLKIAITILIGIKLISDHLQWYEGKRGELKVLGTEVCPRCTSWFYTPTLILPNTSYIEIEAFCDQSSCNFEIWGSLSSRY